jgi:carboxyl-terminal processing protease
MEKKWIGLFFLAAIFLSFAAGFAIKDIFPDRLFSQGSDIYETITSTLEDHYYYNLDDTATLEAYIASMDAIVAYYGSYFNDPYTRIDAYNPSTSTLVRNQVGLGIYIDFVDNIPVVRHVVYKGPSYQKLYPGDQILGIKDGVSFVEFNDINAVTEILREQAYLDNTVTFEVRNAIGNLRDVTITYDILEDTNVTAHQFINTNVSYISIQQFNPYVDENNIGTAQAFKETLAYLETQWLDENGTLIIDLRNNPGGSLTALHNQGNSSLPSGIIQQLLPYDASVNYFSLIDNDGNITNYKGGLTGPKPYEIVVLVNRFSASASEVLAASLQSYGYDVYGEETFGKFVYQNQIPLTEINDTSYVLVYTEGIWTYKDQVTIQEDPIDIILTPTDKIEDIIELKYETIMEKDQVYEPLKDIIRVINLYYQLDLRTDGYFDTDIENAIKDIQNLASIQISGIIDFETFQHIYDLYLSVQYDISYDRELEYVVGRYS